ncbi:MAG: ABC transporter permease [Pseudooceanicola sp.]
MTDNTSEFARSGLDAQPAGLVRRLRNLEPINLLWAALFVLLVVLVVGPIGFLLKVSFQEGGNGAFTLDNYAEAYGRWRYLQALFNSCLLGACTAALCVVFAVPMAWAVSRTNMPAKWFAWASVLGAFILPPYLTSIGWILIAGPNSGWLNEGWYWLTGAETPLFNIYSFFGMVLMIALNAFPFIFLFTKAGLDMISSEMEEAAAILGSPTWYTSLKITLPLVWPSILGGIIIVFLESIALFGVPAILGIPARINLVTTQLFQFFGYPFKMEVAAAYSMPLLLITVALIWVQRLLLNRKGFVTQTGKGGERRELDIGRWKWALLAWCGFVGALAMYLPGYTMVVASFSEAWGKGLTAENLTLQNYYDILFVHKLTQEAIVNSFWFAGVAGMSALAIALCVAYCVSRRLVPFANVLAFLCMAPFVIPGIVMAIGFYAAYAPPPLALYGTAAIIIVAFTARFLPIAYGTAAAGMRSINPEMEEAVRVLGGSRLVAIRHVVAPLLKKTLFAGFLLVVIPATRELSAAIFLVGPETRVMSVLIFDMTEEGRFETVAAIGCIILVTTTFLVWLGFRLVGRDFMMRTPR